MLHWVSWIWYIKNCVIFSSRSSVLTTTHNYWLPLHLIKTYPSSDPKIIVGNDTGMNIQRNGKQIPQLNKKLHHSKCSLMSFVHGKSWATKIAGTLRNIFKKKKIKKYHSLEFGVVREHWGGKSWKGKESFVSLVALFGDVLLLNRGGRALGELRREWWRLSGFLHAIISACNYLWEVSVLGFDWFAAQF